MKVCNNCGTSLHDSDTFCTGCGASVPASYPAYNSTFPAAKESISVGGWIGRSLIPMIPLVGGIIYLVMLFIWSGDTKKEDTFRNWAKAQLIVMAIVIGLSVILGIVFGVALADLL